MWPASGLRVEKGGQLARAAAADEAGLQAPRTCQKLNDRGAFPMGADGEQSAVLLPVQQVPRLRPKVSGRAGSRRLKLVPSQRS